MNTDFRISVHTLWPSQDDQIATAIGLSRGEVVARTLELGGPEPARWQSRRRERPLEALPDYLGLRLMNRLRENTGEVAPCAWASERGLKVAA